MMIESTNVFTLAGVSDALGGLAVPVLIAIVMAIFISLLLFVVKRYKRCPSNRILVVYGKVGGSRSARALHGGGTFVYPIIQDYAFLSLEPITIEIELTSALSKKNIRVAVPSTFTIGISTEPDVMNNAAERLLGLTEQEIAGQARDIILGQMRLVIAMLTIEEINQDREKFLDLVNKNVNYELSKIGLFMINVNIRDITDESGYIDALGKKAAAEAINQAKIDTAQADREGAIGTATADREREVRVAEQNAQAEIGRKQADRDERIQVAALDAQGAEGEAEANRQRDIAVAREAALAVEGKKEAETSQRVKVASLEADAIEGENTSKAEIAKSDATYHEREAEAKRRGEVALAQSRAEVLKAEKEQELARMQKEVIAKETIERQQVEINAEAEAEQKRRIAKGEADATLAKYQAEADGQKKLLDAKAAGYRALVEACATRPDIAPSLLIIEKLPELVAEQVKAIQNLKIDKVTVWDGAGGSGGDGEGANGSTARFLRGLIGALPPVHELAEQAGIDLPEVLGRVREAEEYVDDTRWHQAPSPYTEPGPVAADVDESPEAEEPDEADEKTG